jgi:hypothetical protein
MEEDEGLQKAGPVRWLEHYLHFFWFRCCMEEEDEGLQKAGPC